jgi:hypothetical protein
MRGARRSANRGVLDCTLRKRAEHNEADAGMSCVLQVPRDTMGAGISPRPESAYAAFIKRLSRVSVASCSWRSAAS